MLRLFIILLTLQSSHLNKAFVLQDRFYLYKTLTLGIIHKGCPHKCGTFWNHPPLVQACPHLVDDPPPPLSVQTQGWYYLKHCNL